VKKWIAEIVAAYPIGKIFSSRDVVESFLSSRWKHFTPEAVTIGMELPKLDHVTKIKINSKNMYKRVWCKSLDNEEE